MNKTLIIIASIVGFFLIIGLWFSGTYNSLVTQEEAVSAQWKNIEVVYQARADKTKNLMEIVKGAANFEKSTLQAVVDARSKATSIQLNADDLTPEKMAQFEKAQAQFSSSLGKLMAISENYPQLQAVQAFRDFQTQYEGMENRISTERRRFNEVAQTYNTYIRKFPRNIVSSMFGFEKKAYFSSQEGTENAPDINMKLN
ncbi:MAG: LemA family protein [Bacteroidota bacterium]